MSEYGWENKLARQCLSEYRWEIKVVYVERRICRNTGGKINVWRGIAGEAWFAVIQVENKLFVLVEYRWKTKLGCWGRGFQEHRCEIKLREVAAEAGACGNTGVGKW